MVEVIGVGDLHLDKLDKVVPDVNLHITRSLRRVFNYALERGIKYIIFYGDIGEKARISYEGHKLLFRLLLHPKYRELEIHIILGNHDFAEDGTHSLEVVQVVTDLFAQSSVKVYTEPEEVSLGGVNFRMLPHPSIDTSKRVINVGHFEVQGAKRDNGRQVEEGFDNDHVCVVGHLHTNHRVRNCFFSGTLYQTNFGEALPKFFHHIRANSAKDYDVSSIRFKPPWELINLEVKKQEDLELLKNPDTFSYYKLFIKDGLDIDVNSILTQYPNVVKHNYFKNKQELELLVQEGWRLDEDLIDQAVTFDENEVVDEMLRGMGLSDAQLKMSRRIRKRISGG